MSYFNCFDCRKVVPIRGSQTDKCPLCQGCNGNVIESEQLKEGMDAGAFYNIDPSTGKRMKNRK